MYKKAITLFPVMFLFGFLSQAQPAVTDLIRAGIAYQDGSQTKEPVKFYKKVLKKYTNNCLLYCKQVVS